MLASTIIEMETTFGRKNVLSLLELNPMITSGLTNYAGLEPPCEGEGGGGGGVSAGGMSVSHGCIPTLELSEIICNPLPHLHKNLCPKLTWTHLFIVFSPCPREMINLTLNPHPFSWL